jgi:hypothetical protein
MHTPAARNPGPNHHPPRLRARRPFSSSSSTSRSASSSARRATHRDRAAGSDVESNDLQLAVGSWGGGGAGRLSGAVGAWWERGQDVDMQEGDWVSPPQLFNCYCGSPHLLMLLVLSFGVTGSLSTPLQVSRTHLERRGGWWLGGKSAPCVVGGFCRLLF